MSIYKGFSFFRYQYNKSIVLTDIDIVKVDIYNHIFTRKGTRVKMFNYGTAIPDMLFEQLTEELVAQLEGEILNVIEFDPRVELISIQAIPFFETSSVYVIADLKYIELNVVDRFDLNLQFQG